MIRRDFLASASALAAASILPTAQAGQPCTPAGFKIDGAANPDTTCVIPAGASLSALARSMTAGSWAKLVAGGQDLALGVGTVSGSMIHYCNSMPWNPLDKCIEIVGMDHNALMQRYVRYSETDAAFRVMLTDTGVGTSTRHGYDHSAVNPYTGDLYHRLAQYDYENTGLVVYRKPRAGSTFGAMAPVPKLFYGQNAIGVTWWSGAFSGAGAQGCLLIYNSGDSALGGSAQDGGMYAYDPLANSWFWKSRGVSPNYGTTGESYHSVLEYSSTYNCAVYGGGNDNPRKLWRMDSDRSVHVLTDVPAGKGCGVQNGVLTADPVTGKFILLSAGELWELDPTGAGTWTNLTGSRKPPAGVGIPGPVTHEGVTCTAIDAYGVIAYITQSTWTGGTMYLYKHA